jgi:SPP1 gp7 family putative phage head morphogenesis protein
MADLTENCVVEVAGSWTDNADAWDADISAGDDAYTATGDATTEGRVTASSPFSAIPSGSTITGIQCEVYGNSNDDDDLLWFEPYHTTDAEYGTVASNHPPNGTPDWFTLGGTTSQYGKTWSADNDIKVSTFGARLTYKNLTKANGVSVYAVRLKVYYTPPATACEVYAAEAILDYTAPAEVYAAEGILDYEAPAEVYATEAILDYVAPAEVYAAEAILDYEVPPCEVYAAEAILDYEAPTEVYAAEAILDYVAPAEVYASEAILDYISPAEVYAAEAILDYEVPPCEVYAAEIILDYTPLATGGGSPGAFRWPYLPTTKAEEPPLPKKPRHIRVTDNLDLTDDARVVHRECVVKDEAHLDDRVSVWGHLKLIDSIVLEDNALMHRYVTAKDTAHMEDSLSIFATLTTRTPIVRERALEPSEKIHELARKRRPSLLRYRLARSKDPSLTRRIENEYARELDGLFLAFKRDAAKILGIRELADDDWIDEVDAPDLMEKFDRVIEITIREPGGRVVRKFTTRAYTVGGLRSSQFLTSLGIKAIFSILPADRAAIDILLTRDLSGLKGITDELSKQIMQEITDGMLRGDSMAEVARAIDQRVDSIGRVRAEVLARTETMKAYNEGAITQYEKHGITEVEWLASYGDRTCDECAMLDGERFPIDRKPDCPLHPNCRCTLLPVIPEV